MTAAHLRREAERQEAIILGNQTALPKKKLRRKRVKLHPTASDTGCSTRQQFSERQTSTPPSPTKSKQFIFLDCLELNVSKFYE